MGLGLMMRLRDLLSQDNIYYLDEILEILTNPAPGNMAQTYSAFWATFNNRLGHTASDVATPEAKAAWNALRKLQGIVRDYRKGEGA